MRPSRFWLQLVKTGPLQALKSGNPSKKNALSSLDMCFPARLYPDARKMRRKVTLHIGPTNSGKSYTALQEFKAAKSGFYAGPLRMLAREVFERMQSENIPCNLLTGDERIEGTNPDGTPAGLFSGTVEMVNLHKKFDVAVLDEIQMIEDPDRGSAWTTAFLGVQAKHIHLCGDPNAENIIRQLCVQTGDELIVKNYERLSPLKLDREELTQANFLRKLQPGDCLVCFSAKKVRSLRDKIVQSGKQCAVVYGSLPPESRATQARLFNDPNSGVDYMVASDAIGMGLNLAIKRVILTEITKFDGRRVVELPIAQVKQIVGRAGRFKVPNRDPAEPDTAAGDGGLANCISSEGKQLIKKALWKKSPGACHASIFPPSESIKAFAIDKKGAFSDILYDALTSAKLGPAYMRPRYEELVNIAKLIDDIPGLTVSDRLVLGHAPIHRGPEIAQAFQSFSRVIGNRESRNVLEICSILRGLDRPQVILSELEIIHKILTLYMWLALRYPCNLLDPEGAQDLRVLCEAQIDERLRSRRNLATPQDAQNQGKRKKKHKRR